MGQSGGGRWPYGENIEIVKNGLTKSGEQEYYCRECRFYFTPNNNPDYHLSRFDAETMRLTALWYFRFNLSLRNLAEIMLSRDIEVSHKTIARWIKKIGPKIEKKSAKRFFQENLEINESKTRTDLQCLPRSK